MKKLILLFTFIPVLGYSQSLSPEVISSSGYSNTVAGYTLDFTVGELMTLTMSAASNSLTEGFHQPEIHFFSIPTNNSDNTITVYPNPTSSYVNIVSSGSELKMVYVFDLNGKCVLSSLNFTDKLTIDLSTLHASTYVLNIISISGEKLNSYKLIKH